MTTPTTPITTIALTATIKTRAVQASTIKVWKRCAQEWLTNRPADQEGCYIFAFQLCFHRKSRWRIPSGTLSYTTQTHIYTKKKRSKVEKKTEEHMNKKSRICRARICSNIQIFYVPTFTANRIIYFQNRDTIENPTIDTFNQLF